MSNDIPMVVSGAAGVAGLSVDVALFPWTRSKRGCGRRGVS